MGNDGGSIPTRRELVKEAARNPTTTELKETQQEQQEYDWTTCPLSHSPLAQPIVSDCLGKLYNKDAVLRFLLPAEDGASKADGEEVLAGRVRSLRDVVEIKFEEDKEARKGEAHAGARWICPVTRKQLGPKVKSVYLSPCGHAFSESAIREVAESMCLQCNERFTSDNIIPILPISPADVERLATRAQKLKEQGLTHSLKKMSGSGKKRKKNDLAAAGPIDGIIESHKSENRSAPSTPLPSNATAPSSNAIKDASTASLTAKVLEDERERNKKRKLGMNENLKTLFSSGEVSRGGGTDFMTRGYSIPAGTKR